MTTESLERGNKILEEILSQKENGRKIAELISRYEDGRYFEIEIDRMDKLFMSGNPINTEEKIIVLRFLKDFEASIASETNKLEQQLAGL